MPGNDLTSLRDIVPVSADQQATARANITTILNGIINDIEPKVTPAGLDMSSALNFLSSGVYSPVTNLGYLNMQDRSESPGVNESLYVASDELYFRDGSGNEVAITSSGGVASAAGNITGAGYGTPVEVNWNTGSGEYRMKKAAGTHDLADVVMDRARFSDGTAYFATLGASASMAATLAYTLPVAFPGSTSAMTMTSAGVMGHTRDLSIDTVTTSGDVTADDYKISGTRVKVVAGIGWFGLEGSYTGGAFTGANGAALYLPLGLDYEDRVTNIQVYCKQTAPGTVTLALHTVDASGGLSAAIATDTDTAWGAGAISLTLASLTATQGSTDGLILKISSSGSGAVTALSTEISYDRP